MGLTNIQRQIADCNKPVIRIEAYSDCYDNITSEYYGSGYKKTMNLKGFIKSLPRDIERVVSFNCRTQQVRSTELYNIQGADLYPEWKKRELEDFFSLQHIVIDGVEINFLGGRIFEEANSGCPKLYRLNANIEECLKQQIHGCATTCESNQITFLIPERSLDDKFYNSGGQLIATTFAGLMQWFSVQNGVKEVEEISAQVDCLYTHVFRVTGSGVPTIFYFDSPTIGNKVIGKIVSQDNLNSLCNGVNNNLCGTLLADTPTVYELTCGDMTVGTINVFIIGQNCDVEAVGNWTESGINEITSVGSAKTLTLKLESSFYVEPPAPSTGTTFSYTSSTQTNCAIQTDIADDAVIQEVRRNGIVQTGGQYSYDAMTKIITLTNCLDTNDTLEIDYSFTSYPVISEIVARITGTQCQPKQMYTFNHYTNPQIPEGASLILYPSGDIKWNGKVTFADNSGSLIEIDNIYYESL